MPCGFQTMSDNSLRNRTWAGSFKSPHRLSCLEFALWETVLFASLGDSPRVSTKELLYLDDAGRLPRIRILYEIFTRPSICLVLSLSLVGLTTPSACSHSLRCNLHYVALGIWPSIGLWGYAPIASMKLTKRINRGLRFIFPACRNADYRRLKQSLEYCSHAPVGR